MGKLTVQFSGKADEDLETLAREQGVPKSHVIRRSVALLKYLEDERSKGNKVAITDEDDRVLKEIVSG